MTESKPRNYWTNIDNVKLEIEKIMHEKESDTLPSCYQLREWGYSSLAHAIYTYHGGFRHFRTLLGEEQKITEDGKWQDLSYAIEQARRVMEEKKVDVLPSSTLLCEWGHSGLVAAIHTYHGGFHEFRTLLGENQKRTEHGKWQELKYAIEQAKQLMEEKKIATLPSSTLLCEWGHSGLANAISMYHGGFPVFRQELANYLGQPSQKVQLETILDEYIYPTEE